MVYFCSQVWDKPITGTASQHSDPALQSTIAQAESFSLFVRQSQGAGTSPLVLVGGRRPAGGGAVAAELE